MQEEQLQKKGSIAKARRRRQPASPTPATTTPSGSEEATATTTPKEASSNKQPSTPPASKTTPSNAQKALVESKKKEIAQRKGLSTTFTASSQSNKSNKNASSERSANTFQQQEEEQEPLQAEVRLARLEATEAAHRSLHECQHHTAVASLTAKHLVEPLQRENRALFEDIGEWSERGAEFDAEVAQLLQQLHAAEKERDEVVKSNRAFRAESERLHEQLAALESISDQQQFNNNNSAAGGVQVKRRGSTPTALAAHAAEMKQEQEQLRKRNAALQNLVEELETDLLKERTRLSELQRNNRFENSEKEQQPLPSLQCDSCQRTRAQLSAVEEQRDKLQRALQKQHGSDGAATADEAMMAQIPSVNNDKQYVKLLQAEVKSKDDEICDAKQRLALLEEQVKKFEGTNSHLVPRSADIVAAAVGNMLSSSSSSSSPRKASPPKEVRQKEGNEDDANAWYEDAITSANSVSKILDEDAAAFCVSSQKKTLEALRAALREELTHFTSSTSANLTTAASNGGDLVASPRDAAATRGAAAAARRSQSVCFASVPLFASPMPPSSSSSHPLLTPNMANALQEKVVSAVASAIATTPPTHKNNNKHAAPSDMQHQQQHRVCRIVKAKDFELKKALFHKKQLQTEVGKLRQVITELRESRMKGEVQSIMPLIDTLSHTLDYGGIVDDVFEGKARTYEVAALSAELDRVYGENEELRRRLCVVNRHLQTLSIQNLASASAAGSDENQQQQQPTTQQQTSTAFLEKLGFGEKKKRDADDDAVEREQPDHHQHRQQDALVAIHATMSKEPPSLSHLNRTTTTTMPTPLRLQQQQQLDIATLEEKMARIDAVRQHLLELEYSAVNSSNATFRKLLLEEMSNIHSSSLKGDGAAKGSAAQQQQLQQQQRPDHRRFDDDGNNGADVHAAVLRHQAEYDRQQQYEQQQRRQNNNAGEGRTGETTDDDSTAQRRYFDNEDHLRGRQIEPVTRHSFVDADDQRVGSDGKRNSKNPMLLFEALNEIRRIEGTMRRDRR